MNEQNIPMGIPPDEFELMWRALQEAVPGAVEEVKDTVFGPQRLLLDGTDKRRALIVEAVTKPEWTTYRRPTINRYLTDLGWKALGRPDVRKERT